MEPAVLILDLDGTLYPHTNPLTDRIDALVANLFSDYVSSHPGGLCELERRFPCVLDGLVEANIGRDRFYRAVYDNISYEGCLVPDIVLKKVLEVVAIPMFVVSISPVCHIRRVLGDLAIDDVFDAVMSLEELPTNSKGPVYAEIIDQAGVSAQSAIVVGDNYEVDLAPALQLGCRVVQIGKAGQPEGVLSVENIHDLPWHDLKL